MKISLTLMMMTDEIVAAFTCGLCDQRVMHKMACKGVNNPSVSSLTV
jgi:hypothetical protein